VTDLTQGAAPADEGLARNTAVMAVGTVLSRLSGFGRVLALAYALDFHRLTDSYNIANTTPNIVYELVLGGVLSATLIPVVVDQLAHRDEERAWRNISALVTIATAVLVAVSALFALAAPAVIAVYTLGNHSASLHDQRAVATELLRLFSPQVLLLGLITLATAVLNVRRRFAAPTWTPILLNVWTIAVLVAFPHVAKSLTLAAVRHDTKALLLLGVGTTVGYLVQLLAMVPSLRRADLHLRWVWDPRNEAVRLTLRLSSWTVGVVVANQLSFALIIVLANGVDGGFSAFTAAFLFFQLPHAILAVSIMSALMPGLSEQWARGEREAFRRDIARGLRTTAAVLVPAAAGYALLARPFIQLVLEHGRLSPHAAGLTADLLALFAVGLPGFSLYLLAMRAFQAMKDTRTMFVLYLGENLLTAALAVVLYQRIGVQGLALAYVAPYTLFTVFALARLHRDTGGLDVAGIVRSLVRVGVCTAVMSAVMAVLIHLLSGSAARVACSFVAGGTVYVGLAKATGLDEFLALLRPGRRTS
jgi:putative peptidoglycan lipid II flippase